MPHVLIISPRTDVAGCGIGLKRAFDDVGGEWEARHVRGGGEWLDYPADAEWDQLEDLAVWADVYHVMELPQDMQHLPRKPTIVQHLGTRYRRDPKRMETICTGLGAQEVTGSLDLTLLRRKAWLPVTSDLASHAARRSVRAPGPIRVAHAPTNRALKSTDVILSALGRLPVEVDLIEGRPWYECLERKARADIYVDELTLGYGLNAIEAWAMGIPVVSGVAEPRFRHAMITHFGSLPFADATPDTVESVLGGLIESADLRVEWGERGRQHAERFHSHRAVVERAAALYTRAIGVWRKHGTRLARRMTA